MLLGEQPLSIEGTITEIGEIRNGTAEVKINGKGWCKLNKDGNFLPFSETEMANGISIKKMFGNFLVEKNGDIISEYGVYKDIISLGNLGFTATKLENNKPILLDNQFVEIDTEESYIKLKYIEETNHLIAVKEDNKSHSSIYFSSRTEKYYGIITIDGKVLLPLEYQSIYYEKKSNLYVAKNIKGKYVLIKNNGCDLIPGEFDKISVQENGTISVFVANQSESIDSDGLQVLRAVKQLDQNHYIFQWFNNYGVVLAGGEMVIPAIYSSIERWNEEILICKKNVQPFELYSLVKIDGTVLLCGNYISPLQKGIASIINEQGNTVFVDSQGLPIKVRIKILPDYYLTSFQGFYGLVDSNSNVIIEEKYIRIIPLHHNLFEIQDENGFGIANSQGEILIPCENESIFAYSGKLVCVKGNDIIDTGISYSYQTPLTLTVNNRIRHNKGIILQIGKKTAFISDNTLTKAKRTSSQFNNGDRVKVIISHINWEMKRIYARFLSIKDITFIEGQIIEVEVTSKMAYAILAKDSEGNKIFIHKSMISNSKFNKTKEHDRLYIVKTGFDQQHKKDIWKVAEEQIIDILK